VCEAGAQTALSCAGTDTSMTRKIKLVSGGWFQATAGGTVDSQWKKPVDSQ
jgi:hypothetical protein